MMGDAFVNQEAAYNMVAGAEIRRDNPNITDPVVGYMDACLTRPGVVWMAARMGHDGMGCDHHNSTAHRTLRLGAGDLASAHVEGVAACEREGAPVWPYVAIAAALGFVADEQQNPTSHREWRAYTKEYIALFKDGYRTLGDMTQDAKSLEDGRCLDRACLGVALTLIALARKHRFPEPPGGLPGVVPDAEDDDGA